MLAATATGQHHAASPAGARTTAAIIAAVGLALLVAACGSSSSPNSPATSAQQSAALAYSRCMRSHRVPRYPDPSRGHVLPDGLPKVSFQRLGVGSSQFAAAESACGHLLPNGGAFTGAASEHTASDMVRFSACMRSHGVPNWPDPTTISGGLGFNLIGIAPPVDTNSPRFQQALHECGHLVPRAVGGIRIRQP